jgi:hypothetical protein
MPTELPEWPIKPKKTDRYNHLFDGKVWKIHPSEFDYEEDELKSFSSNLKQAATKQGIYIRTFITLDNHIIVQKRGDDYVPKNILKRKKDAN